MATKITKNELNVLNVLIEGDPDKSRDDIINCVKEDCDQICNGYNELATEDVAAQLTMKVPSVRGVLGSLAAKGLIHVDPDDKMLCILPDGVIALLAAQGIDITAKPEEEAETEAAESAEDEAEDAADEPEPKAEPAPAKPEPKADDKPAADDGEEKRSKKEIAQDIFNEMQGQARKDIIKRFMEEAKLTKNGASTYYHNLKSAAEKK